MATKYKSSIASSTTLTNANAWADSSSALGTAATVGPATGDIIQFQTGSLGVLSSGAGYTGAVDVSGATGGIVQYGTLTPSTNNAKFGGLVSIGGAGIVQDVTNTTNLEFVGGVSVGATDQTWVSYTTKSGVAGLALGSALSGSATITITRPPTATLPGYLYSYATASAFTGVIALSDNTSFGVSATGTQHAIGPAATIRITGASTELYPTAANAVLSSKVVVAAAVTVNTGNLSALTQNLNLNNATAALDVGSYAPTINVRTSGGLTVSGPVLGSAGFTKSGSGALVLSGDSRSTLNGTISVTAGNLHLGSGVAGGNGSLVLGSGTTVEIGASGSVNVALGGLTGTNSTTFRHPTGVNGGGLAVYQAAGTGLTFTEGQLVGLTGTTAPTGGASSALAYGSGLALYADGNTPNTVGNVTTPELPAAVGFYYGNAGATAVTTKLFFTGKAAGNDYSSTDVYLTNAYLAASPNPATNITHGIYANQTTGGALKIRNIKRTNTGNGNTNPYTFRLGGTSDPSLDNTVTGVISSDVSTLNIIKEDANTWVLAGDNTYNGATTVSAGTLKVGHNNALKNSAVSLNAGTITINNGVTTPTFASLAGAGSTATLNIPAGTTLTAGGNNATTTYAGTVSGAGTFTKAGSGSFTLTGTSSGFTGTFAVSGGTAFVGSGTGSATHLGNASTFDVTGGLVFYGNLATPFTAAFRGSGTVQTNIGAAQATYSGDWSAFTGYVSSYTASNITVPAVFSTAAAFPVAGSTYSDIPGNAVTATFIWRYAGAADVSTSGGNYSAFRNASGSSVLTTEFDNASSNGSTVTYAGNFGTIPGGTISAASHIVRLNASAGPIVVTGNILSGVTPRSVQKNGTFKTTLSGTNTHTGTTRPMVGELAITNQLALQNSPLEMTSGDTGTVTFSGAAATAATIGGLTQTTTARAYSVPANFMLTLNVTSAAEQLYGGQLTVPATSTVTKTGSTGQVFNQDSTGFAGTLDIQTGSFTLGQGSTTGSIAAKEIKVASGASFLYSRGTNAVTHPATSPITGAGTVMNWYTAPLTFAAGALAGFTGTLTTRTDTTVSAGAITTNETADIVLAGFGGANTAAAWIKNGTGKVTLTNGGNNAGPWSLNVGEVAVNGALTATTGAITVASGAKLTGTGAISKPVTINSGSTGNNFTVAGAPAVTINGTATVNGNTTGAVTVGSTGVANLNGSTGVLTVDGMATTLSATSNTSGKLTLGSSAKSVLTLPADRTITAAGSTDAITVGSLGTAAAALYQTGAGSVFSHSNTSQSGGAYVGIGGWATAGYGYYRGTGGTLGPVSNMFDVYNGVAEFDGVSLGAVAQMKAYGTDGTRVAVINFLRGTNTLTATGANAVSVNYGTVATGAYAAINVDGQNDAALALTVNADIRMHSVAGATSLVNVARGATLTTTFFRPLTTAYAYDTAVVGTRQVNLWGGTLSLSSSVSSSSLPANLRFGIYGTGNKLGSPAAGTGIITAPISAPTGYGVLRVDVSSQGTGYIGPPALRLTGGSGAGAAARAVVDLDPASPTYQRITSVVVTSPGYGYLVSDTVTITPVGGGGTGFAATAVLASLSDPTNNITFDGHIEKVGAGTLAFAAANTYAGSTTVSAGTLNIGNNGTAGTLGPSSVASGYGTSNAILSGGTLGFNRNENLTYGGTLSGTSTSGGISKPVTTTVVTATISGDNSFLSPVSVAGGTLRATHVNAFGSADATTNITVTAGAADFHAGAGTSITSARGFSIAGTGVVGGALRVTSGSVTLNGNGALSAAASVDADTDAWLTLNGAISGAAAASFTKGTSAGTVVLGAVNSFAGTVTVNGGTLSYRWASDNGVQGSLGAGSAAITVANNGSLEYSGALPATTNRTVAFSTVAAGFVYLAGSGAGPITYRTVPTITKSGVVGTTKTLVLHGTAQNANKIDAVIAEPTGTGNFAIAKRGGGTWVLSRANTFTSNVSVEGGTLVAAAEDGSGRFGSVLGGSTQVVSVESAGRIQTLTGTTQRGRHQYNNLTFKSGATIRIGGTVSAGTLSMRGNLNLSTLTAGQKVTWALTDRIYQTPNTYDLMVFATGTLQLPGGADPTAATLSDYITVVPPTGVSATNLRYDTSGAYPTIKVTIVAA